MRGVESLLLRSCLYIPHEKAFGGCSSAGTVRCLPGEDRHRSGGFGLREQPTDEQEKAHHCGNEGAVIASPASTIIRTQIRPAFSGWPDAFYRLVLERTLYFRERSGARLSPSNPAARRGHREWTVTWGGPRPGSFRSLAASHSQPLCKWEV